MIKRIFSFMAILLVLMTVVAVPMSALNNADVGNKVYTIAVKNHEELYNNNYDLYQYNVASIDTGFGSYVSDTRGFMFNTFGSSYGGGGGVADGYYTITLYNDTYLTISIVNGKFSIYYNFIPAYDSYAISIAICQNIDVYYDIMFYVNRVGQIRYCIFETGVGYVDNDYELNSLNWYGVLFPYGEIPTASYEDGYIDGYNSGISASYNEAYTKGFADGQDSTLIPKIAIEGFFNGLTGFFAPFLSIGIGSLTIGNLLAVLIGTFIVIVIIYVIRGK